jgi:hypothetical protein
MNNGKKGGGMWYHSHLFAFKDEPLLRWGDAFLLLDLFLDPSNLMLRKPK